MKFFRTNEKLPSYEQSVLLRDVSDKYFTGMLMCDEEGEYWVYDLPVEACFNTVVEQEIHSWSYLPE